MAFGGVREDALIENVQLLGGRVLLQQLARDLALGGEDNAVAGENTEGSSGVGDGLKRILDLVEAAFGGEDGCLAQ
jgi:hypothetical protein